MEPPLNQAEVDFQDVELFLTEYGNEIDTADQDDTYEEHEIADILAVSWREKRQELNKLRQARQFHKEADTRKTYRIEVEELKKRTRCHRCKKIGHWAKECKAPRNNVPKPAASSGSTHAAGCVQAVDTEHFVCAAGWITASLPTCHEKVVCRDGFFL